MSLKFYADWEVPEFGEFDEVAENGSSTIEQIVGSPIGRGNRIARVTVDGTSMAYADKEFSPALPISPGGDIFVGLWYRCNQLPATSYSCVAFIRNSTPDHLVFLYQNTSGRLYLFARKDGSTINYGASLYPINLGQWCYVVLRLHRAATEVSGDGYGELYIDGTSVDKTDLIDNYDNAADIGFLYAGAYVAANEGSIIDLDEIKIGDTWASVQPSWQPHSGLVSNAPKHPIIPHMVIGGLTNRRSANW